MTFSRNWGSLPALSIISFSLLLHVSSQEAANKLCPLNEHVVCNEMSEHSMRCVCTMFGSSSPAPEQSCSNLLNLTAGPLEATSVKLRLAPTFFPPTRAADVNVTETSNSADNVLEGKFKSQLARHLKTNEKNVVFLRLRCQDDGTSDVVVQFVVVRSRKRLSPPYSRSELISAESVVRRIKEMRESQQRAGGMEILHVEKVNELVPVEVDTDNSRLILQAIVVGAFMLATCLCGCCIASRGKRPEDEGYEDVAQRGDKV